MLSDFKARHVLNLEVAAQRKISKPQCQPELPKLEISQQTRNLSNEQSVQSAPPTIPPGHTFKFVFIPYYAGNLYNFCKRVFLKFHKKTL